MQRETGRRRLATMADGSGAHEKINPLCQHSSPGVEAELTDHFRTPCLASPRLSVMQLAGSSAAERDLSSFRVAVALNLWRAPGQRAALRQSDDPTSAKEPQRNAITSSSFPSAPSTTAMIDGSMDHCPRHGIKCGNPP